MNRTIVHLLLAGLLVQAPVPAAERPTADPPGFATKPPANTAALRIEGLRCEHLCDPVGIDVLEPRLSWRLVSPTCKRGARQTAFQVLVASSPAELARDRGDVWDSGRVESAQSVLVPYRGRPLKSNQFCCWKVRAWDEAGHATACSAPACWSMGLLDEADWRGATWIGRDETDEEGVSIADLKQAQWLWYPEGDAAHDAPTEARYFRRRVTLPTNARVQRALCFFAGDDVCTFYVNGVHVGVGHGHPMLAGADITGYLRPGANELAVQAVNQPADVPNNPGGWIGVVRVELAGAEPIIVHSDASWKSARQTGANWQTADFGDAAWVDARALGQAGIAPWGTPWPETWRSEHRRLPGRYLRREFQTREGKTPSRATAFICGLGFFDLHVNGRRLDDQRLNPALTGYDQRALYVTFDLTSHIVPGANAVGVVLSNGRFFAPRVANPMPMRNYGYPKLRACLRLEYADGSTQDIITDDSWLVTTEGPLRASNEFDGEEYDARREQPGWDEPGFTGAGWAPASVVSAPGGALEAQMIEPVRVTEVLRPQQLLEPTPGVWMVDFGQAFYGVVQLTASGPAGASVKMRTSFNILPDGTLNFINDRSAQNMDVYTFRGEGVETWSPRFRGNATRWVQVEGFPGRPTAENFAGLVTHTDHEVVGEFSCSNDLINRVYASARWGTRMQNRSVPMEPDRDERMPWSGHPAKTSESEGWVFHVARFYEHFLHNYRVHQADDGSLQEILPPYWLFNSKDIVWPSVATIIPDWYCDFYGDAQPLRDNYEMMKRFVLYHERQHLKADGTLDHCTYGDWVDAASIGSNARNFGATSRPLIGTAYFYHNCRIVQRAAARFGRDEDRLYFANLAERVQRGFLQRFFDPASDRFESGTQCSYILPLAFGLVPDPHVPGVVRNLAADIHAHEGHTTVGLIGNQWLMQVLAAHGLHEEAFLIATRRDRPSWGYMIDHGATTIWERWDSDTQDGGMNGESQKILSGNFEAWCFQMLGGIHYDRENPGFRLVRLQPVPVGDLTWVQASHAGPYGRIVSHWRIEDGRFHWHVEVPPNSTAVATVPTTQPDSVAEGGQPIAKVPDVEVIRVTARGVEVRLPSGAYEFTAPR
ncbi:MAG: glycoside hydrolase family 78 protein [Pirellulaceae bacterium]|jgi:alpha-L-rhamnosidase|nr:glycoside hydrolase family 78 protein [Pirellulaceae bacterium]